MSIFFYSCIFIQFNFSILPWLFQVSMCQAVHSSVATNSIKYKQELSRHNYVTPTSYLELLGIFQNLIDLKKNEVQQSKKQDQDGFR